MAMKKISTLVALSLIVSCLSCNQQGIEREISTSRMMELVNELSSATYGGRQAGTKGDALACDYLVTEFTNLGLQPFFSNDYRQEIRVEQNEIVSAYFATTKGNRLIPHRLGSDYSCRGFSGSGKIAGPMIFCGYGYPTDYNGAYIKKNVVIVFKANALYRERDSGSTPMMPRDKARVAMQNGAKAIIFLPNPNDWQIAEAQGSVYDGAAPNLDSFPMLQLSPAFAKSLFNQNGKDIAKIMSKMDSKKITLPLKLNETATIEVAAHYKPCAVSNNIAAVLDGSDPLLKNELIIVGAHIDHVGNQAGLIFPGANDNASGVAAIREIATVMAQHRELVKRSVVFVIFTGEELGLLGSTYFVNNLTPNQKVVAMLNFDCVAEGDSISVRGKTSMPLLYDIVKQEDGKMNSWVANESIIGGGADAEPFYQHGIPTLYFTTTKGYHHLHMASDNMKSLNTKLFTGIAQLGLNVTLRLASGDYDGEITTPIP